MLFGGKVEGLRRADSLYALYSTLREAGVDLEDLTSRLEAEFRPERAIVNEVAQAIHRRDYVVDASFMFQNARDGFGTEGYIPTTSLPEALAEILPEQYDSVPLQEIAEAHETSFHENIRRTKSESLAQKVTERHIQNLSVDLYAVLVKQMGDSVQERVQDVVGAFWDEVVGSQKVYMKPGEVLPYTHNGDGVVVTERAEIQFCPQWYDIRASGFAERQEQDFRNQKLDKVSPVVWNRVAENLFLMPESTRYKNHGENALEPNRVQSKFVDYTFRHQERTLPSVVLSYSPDIIETTPCGIYVAATRGVVPLHTGADRDDMVTALAAIAAYKPVLDKMYGVREVEEQVPRDGIIGRVTDIFRPRYVKRLHIPKQGEALVA